MLIYLFKIDLDINLQNLMKNPLKAPISYSFEWKYKNFWDNY